MADTDFRDHYFYQGYLWTPADFSNMQNWLNAQMRGNMEGAFGKSILTGLKVSPAGGMVLNVEPGIAVTANGRLMVVGSQQQGTFATPSGNPAKSLIVLRPVETDSNNIPEPTNPGNNVPLHKKLLYSVVVINGTPAASPAYPATQANDVVLMGVSLANGQSSITAADFDYTVLSLPQRLREVVQQLTGSGDINIQSKFIEVDASGGAATANLPVAASGANLEYVVVKTDSSANPVSVYSSELISGQALQVIDSQWGSVKSYSNGKTYRSF